MAQAAKSTEENAESVKTDFSSVEKDLAQLKGDVKRLTDTLEEIVRSRVEQGKNEAANKYEDAKQRAAEFRGQAEEAVDDSLLRARSTVARRPLTSLAAAAGIGVALGMLLRR